LVLKDPDVTPAATIDLVRIEHDANSDPEPGGWVRLGNVLHNQRCIGLTTRRVKLGEPIEGTKVAHLTGTEPLALDTAAKEALSTFVRSGGTLIIDAAGGSSAFASQIEADLAAIFVGNPLTAIP